MLISVLECVRQRRVLLENPNALIHFLHVMKVNLTSQVVVVVS